MPPPSPGAQDPYRYFRQEAREILDALTRGILGAERGTSPELGRQLFRLAHTLKGAAGVVKQDGIQQRAHVIEDALAAWRDGMEPLPRAGINELLGHVDQIAEHLAALGDGGGPGAGHRTPESGDEVLEVVRVESDDVERLLEGIGALAVEVSGFRHIASGVAPAAKGSAAALAPMASIQDRLLSAVERAERELDGLRHCAGALQLLPARALFIEAERAARDVAVVSGKEIDFDARGAECRVDAPVLAGVRSALLHVVRNAVAHGIEEPAQRRAQGKPARGRVSLAAESRGQRLCFRCEDDGRGIDVAAVGRAAVSAGVASAGEPLSMERAIQWIFAPGLTTTGSVTAAAGRGVGMDVVRSVVDRLNGEVQVRSEPGRGTCVEIVVPVSIAIVEALLVGAGTAEVWLPLSALRSVLRVAAADVIRAGGRPSVLFDGQAVPFARLSTLLGSEGPTDGRAFSTAILELPAGRIALGLDGLGDVRRIAVRSAPKLAGQLPMVSTITLDAEGRPRLVLDPETLRTALVDEAATGREVAVEEKLPILIVDDSLTTRMLEQSILEAHGYEVGLAASAEEGLQMARARRYGLVLVDVQMPGMNGFEFLGAIRSDPDLRELPAIMVTTLDRPEDRRRGLEAGAQDYIVKSEFGEDLLIGTIHDLIG